MLYFIYDGIPIDAHGILQTTKNGIKEKLQ